jgi:hypothetical protein
MRFMPRVLVFVLGIALLLGFGILVYGDSSTAEPPAEYTPPTDLRASIGNEQMVFLWEPLPDEGLNCAATMDFLGTKREVYTTGDWKFTAQFDLLGGAVYAARTSGGNLAKLPFETIAGPADTRSVTFR